MQNQVFGKKKRTNAKIWNVRQLQILIEKCVIHYMVMYMTLFHLRIQIKKEQKTAREFSPFEISVSVIHYMVMYLTIVSL